MFAARPPPEESVVRRAEELAVYAAFAVLPAKWPKVGIIALSLDSSLSSARLHTF
jgi:hypothetical protein